MDPQKPYALFPIINCGVDWLTCTSKRVGVSNALEDFGIRRLEEEKAADGQISAAKRLGYVGLSSGHFFLGQRPGEVMIQVSGPSCTPLAVEAITLSSNVSRIDFQVTIWTEGEQVNLARWTRDAMVRARGLSYAGRTISLIETLPAGDTLSINRRVSAQFGRVYDKTAEAKLGQPRLVWRYEIELKGIAARTQAKRLVQDGAHPSHVSKLVHAWYTMRGVPPAYADPRADLKCQPFVDAPKRDVLSWMRSSLSKTVATAIAKHGRPVVLDALGILPLTPTEEARLYGIIRCKDNAPSPDVQL